MEQSPIQVLLVEDNPVDVRLVEAQLSQSGTFFACEHANSLGEAIDQLARTRVDVILLDLTLPDSSELDTFSTLHKKYIDIPVVILTGREDATLANRAVREGAQDYLFKGKIDSESLARSIRYAIERASRQQAEKELNTAGAIHRHLLPKSPPNRPGLDISGRCEPAAFAGGDYFDFFTMRGNRLGVAIADVAGHGIGPALMMAETRIVLRTLAPITEDLGDLLSQANQVLTPDLYDNAFVTMFIACFESESSTFKYAAAGHPGFILNSSGDSQKLLKSPDPPVGVLKDHQYSSSEAVQLTTSESLFLYTDGIVESADRLGELFGKQRLFDTVRDGYAGTASEIVSSIFQAVQGFSRVKNQSDDMTAVLVKVDTVSSPD